MDRDRWEKLEMLFDGARGLPPEQREDFLVRACGPDAALREELRSLLASRDTAFLFFSRLSDAVRPRPDREDDEAKKKARG